MVELENLGDDLVPGPSQHAARLDRTGLQLGIGLRHHLDQAADVDHGETLLTQDGLEQRERQLLVDRPGCLQGDLAPHAGIDHERLVQQMAERTDHRVDLGILEVQGDRFLGGVDDQGRCQQRRQNYQALGKIP